MDREPLDVLHPQTVLLEEPVERGQRVVAEVLVVDRVELDAVEQVLHVRHLDHPVPARAEELGDPGDEAVQVRHVREHVVGVHQVGPDPFGHELAGELTPEERAAGRDPPLLGYGGDVPCGIHAEHAHAGFAVVLEQVPIVARQLDDQVVRSEPVPGDHFPGEDPRVFDEAGDHRREVRIVVEQELGGDRLRQLEQ